MASRRRSRALHTLAVALLAATLPFAASAECVTPSQETAPATPLVIYGTVTGLGGLCVNEVAIELKGDTKITRDGRHSRSEALGLGQVVRIETRDGAPESAGELDIDYVIAGPAERVRSTQRRVVVMGIEVSVRRDALIRDLEGNNRRFHELTRGDHLEVSGLRLGGGGIVASRIDLRPAGSPAHVTGVAIPVGRDTMYVGRVRGRTANRLGFDRELRGHRVQLRGKWNPRNRMLEEAIIRRRPLLAQQTRRVSIQGYAVARDDSATFGIAETPLHIRNHSKTEISMPVDSLVRVSGQGTAASLRLETLDIEERSQQAVSLVVPPSIEAPDNAPEESPDDEIATDTAHEPIASDRTPADEDLD